MDLVNNLEHSIARQLENYGFNTPTAQESGADIIASVQTRDGDREVVVQVKTSSKPDGLGAAERELHEGSQDRPVRMLGEPYISTRRGQALRARDIPYVDAAGNIWLALPGFYVLVEGRPAPPRLTKVDAGDRLSRPSSLRIIFSLLTNPVLAQATLRELAEKCGTSIGAAQAATADLTENGYLSGKSGSRRLSRSGLLADRWVFDYGTRLLPKLEQTTLGGPSPAWWMDSSHRLPSSVASLGGEAACELLGYPLRSVETLLYGTPPWGTIRKSARLTSSGEAVVKLRERFWSPNPDASATAPSLLIYADLALQDDPRLRTMSRQMRRDDADLRRLWPS